MNGRERVALFIGGAAGVLGTLIVAGGPWATASTQPAAKPAESGRFQLSAWGTGQNVGGRMQVARGAYIIDTKTGDVYTTDNDNAPKLIGTAGKKD
jgi:hypothetical protein